LAIVLLSPAYDARMPSVLVTGATGKVGNAVARALHARGDHVRVLARTPAKASAVLPDDVEVVRGDVTEPGSVRAAVEGCELVFNAVGIPEQWVNDEAVFERVNARGTENVVRAAREAGVRRVVHTSTIDVFDAERGERFDETSLARQPKGTAYERSKQHAEELALAARGDMEVVFVNPAAVYGPGPGSVSLEKQLFEPVVRKRLPGLTPGGMGVVFDEGLARGQILAAERGRDGERYIFCDRHVTLRELAQTVKRVAGRGRVPAVMPVPVAKATATLGEMLARRFGIAPLISHGQLYFLLWNAQPDSSKAQDELGWEPTPLEQGIAASLDG
jgi:nucleoside-diphosphate-sugar epimerase